MRIGIIGSGMMGSTLGTLWAQAGHDVFFASRHPEQLTELVSKTPRSQAGTPEAAAKFGDAVFIGVPYAAMPELAKQLAPLLANKLVLDAGNIVGRRDGALADTIKAEGKGSGGWFQALLPGVRVVKAFNTVHYANLLKEAHRAGDRIGVPLAGDDAKALDEAVKLVRDAGQDPLVLTGGMAASALIDFGSPVWNTNKTVAEIRATLKLG